MRVRASFGLAWLAWLMHAYLNRADNLTASINHVLASTCYVEVTITIKFTHITRLEPSAILTEALLVCIRIVRVAAHNRMAGHHYMPNLLHGKSIALIIMYLAFRPDDLTGRSRLFQIEANRW